jgi:hypothetical protein
VRCFVDEFCELRLSPKASTSYEYLSSPDSNAGRIFSFHIHLKSPDKTVYYGISRALEDSVKRLNPSVESARKNT